MFRKMMILLGVIGGILAMAGLCSAVQVDGHSYLGGQTNHEGIKVLFQADSPSAVTDSTYTDSLGYYQIDLSAGFYDIFFSYEGFGGEEILDQNCFSSVTLPGITLYIHLSGSLSGVIEKNPYIIDATISVQSGDSLLIEPGVIFFFDGDFSFSILGYIHAGGTEEDSIKFVPNEGIEWWDGIYFGSNSSDSCKLEYCIITGSDSQGIYISQANPIISHCNIQGNSVPPFGNGGGIFCYYSNSILINCTISGNSAGNGGGIYCFASSLYISNCTISGNSAGNGGGIYCNNSSPTVVNTIVEGSTGGGGIYFSSPNAIITYDDFHNNEGGNFTGSPPQYLGQLVTVNANGDSCDLYNNIFLDPLFEDPLGGNFQITWASFPTWDETRSPCIDAGDPNPLNYDPDSTVADIGTFYFDQSAFPPEPEIGVSASALDFDSVMIGNQADLPLTIYNLGNMTLVLYNVYTSEPGFSTDFNPADSLITPGDSLLITVTFSPVEITSYNEILTIENNDELAEVALLGVGIPLLEPSIALSADSLDFGSVMMGNQSDLPLTIYNLGDATLILYDITISDSSFTTDFNPADSLITPGDSLLITVTFSPAETISYNEILTIENNDELAEVVLLGAGVPLLEPSIVVSADSLDFGSVMISNQSDLPLTIYNLGDTTLILYDITISDSSFTTDFDPADSLITPGDSLLITVTFSPAETISYNEILTIENNDELAEVVLLGVGIPLLGPSIALSADSLDFGSVMIGNQSDLPLTIYNLGDTTLILYDITISDSSFSTDFDPADSLIAAGDSLLVTVFFMPAEITTYSEVLTIESNDETAVVGLQGEGVGPIEVTLTPYNPPIIIPVSGGSFDYNIEVENLTTVHQTFDLWTVIYLPEVGAMEIFTVTDFTLPGSISIGRDRIQQVPEIAPAGTYTYYAYVGDYPWVVEDYDCFTFEKEGSDFGGSLGSPSDWLCSGEPFTLDVAEINIPKTYALHDSYPNPFNPTTTIRYELPVASWVKLEVFNISGCLVGASASRRTAPLLDGWRDAGYHEVTFDGSGLASGIYIYRLEAKPSLSGQAGEFSATGKMVLLK